MKTMLVTGATDGIGRAAAAALVALGHRVVVHGRSEAKVARVAEALRSDGRGAVETAVGDFADLAAVRRLAADVRARFPRLDVLVNNAGVYAPHRSETRDGNETTFQVNYLAMVALTEALLPALDAAAPARVVIVSSATHAGAPLRVDDLQSTRRYDAYGAYAASKLADLIYAYDLAARLDPARVTVNAMHPGAVATKLLRAGFGGGGISVEAGADTAVCLAVSDEVAGVTGKYFARRRAVASSPESHDADLRRALAARTAAMLKAS